MILHATAIVFLLFAALAANAQSITKRVLFLGNSYTARNSLPAMVASIATSTGDVLQQSSVAPGGYTFRQHTTNNNSLTRINSGNWDYVVLQEQSQIPALSDEYVQENVFPFARQLDSLVKVANPCAETVFYMTWGRKDGDSFNCDVWPPVCTYQGMDSLLNLRYRMMAEANEGFVAPVGAVWNYIRQNFPAINLYNADGSHPSVEGTYAAACTFYTVIFRKDPTLITFQSSLSDDIASAIKIAVKAVAFDTLKEWRVGLYDTQASFTHSLGENGTVEFTNTSLFATDFLWDFGNGDTSTAQNPVRTFLPGSYNVTLTASQCGMSHSITQNVVVTIVSVPTENKDKNEIRIYPIPANNTITINASQHAVGSPYSIVNALGILVQQGTIQAERTTVDVLHLPEGMYFIAIGESIKKMVKIIKQ